ncbi:hypothetical protein [Psychrobacter sp. I-STPA6b]|uniref:hypothetical protein n=1 Tax=Psychrobacter sp. I-STPA6b TaxID=2585718 RepID=UPI001D0C48F5|nr:hypothetical protein [Psychrobacter sp. I-STPA6b]
MDTQLTTPYYLLQTLGQWTLVADLDSQHWAQRHQRLLPLISVQAHIVTTTANTSQQQQHRLNLHYQIHLNECKTPKTLPWFIWEKISKHPQPKDYLWQSTCLECFVAGNKNNTPHHHNEYLELNVASSGHYALYHFDNYRTPDSMPPNHLSCLLADKYKPELQINADPRPILLQGKTPSHYPEEPHTLNRHISINIHMLSHLWDSLSSIQPALILQDQHTKQHLYFAPQHATPPDFHLNSLWTPIQHKL